MRRTFRTPKEYGERILKLLEHRKNSAAVFIFFDLKNMDPHKLSKPSNLKERVINRMQGGVSLDSDSDMTTSLADGLKSDCYVNSTDMHRALKMLERDIGLISIQGKQTIKAIKGREQIHFMGRPSVYMPPPGLVSLKRVLSNPKAIELIVKSLRRMDLLGHLEFILEASLHAIKEASKDKVYEMAKLAEVQADYDINMLDWELLADVLGSMNEDMLKILAQRMASLMIEIPIYYHYILFTSLFLLISSIKTASTG
jgi:hypothetical protein